MANKSGKFDRAHAAGQETTERKQGERNEDRNNTKYFDQAAIAVSLSLTRLSI